MLFASADQRPGMEEDDVSKMPRKYQGTMSLSEQVIHAQRLYENAVIERNKLRAHVAALEADKAALTTALRPFARIERSTFYAADENEEYCIVLGEALHGDNTADFTGQDVELARATLAAHGTKQT